MRKSEYAHLALLPLRMVLFPQMEVALHLFEEPYQRMADQCLEKGEDLGIVLMDPRGLREVGCTAEVIEALDHSASGQAVSVLAVGKERFRILQILSDRPYLVGRVELIEDLEPEAALAEEQDRAWGLFMKLQSMIHEHGFSQEELLAAQSHYSSLSFFIGAQCSFALNFKQEILEARSERSRLAKIIQALERAIPGLERLQAIMQRAGGNGFF